MVILCRVFALVLLALGFGMIAAIPLIAYTNRIESVTRDGVRVVTKSWEASAIHSGDRIDTGSMTLAQRYRLDLPNLTSGWTLPVVRNGQVETVTVASVRRSQPRANLFLFELPLLSTVLGAIVLWRRPSVLALLFGLICANQISTPSIIGELTLLPDSVFGIVAPLLLNFTTEIGIFVLLPFVMRFPVPPTSQVGTAVMRATDVMLVLATVIYGVRCFTLPPGDFTNLWFDDIIPKTALASLVMMTAVRFARATGLDRRRLGWVLAAILVDGATFVFQAWGPPGTLQTVLFAAGFTLPIALAYAMLRHRVIDLGFAVSRTVVYGIITLSLVVLVSFIDWVSGKFLLGGRFSLALEAIVTVAFGVALNTLHHRVEGLVDRVLFRERHRAEQRLEERKRALTFAKASTTVDESLVTEAATVLGLASAAVFRADGNGSYVCAASYGWPGAPALFRDDDLLVRTLRAQERTVTLEMSGITDARFPTGDARPDIVIPLAIRHELRGFVFYGHRKGDMTMDPQECRLVEGLVKEAATSYDAIEADAFRREALALRAVHA